MKHIHTTYNPAPPSNLNIRPARPEDRETITAMTLAAYGEYAAELSAHWEKYRENILTTLAQIAPAEHFVAEQDNHILGSVLLYPANGEIEPEMRLLAVHPDARGQGIGAALVQTCMHHARQSGADTLTLHTSDRMQSAIRLYERLGFIRASELDFFPAPGLTIKGYRLRLGGGE